MSPLSALASVALVGGLCACKAKPADSASSALPATSVPAADSLVLTAGPGVEVWFTDSREEKDTTGAPCVERVMEVRRAGRRIAVPLLYTGEAPRLVDDSTIEAAIWLHCRPGNVYRVNLATGYPTRVR